MDVNPNNNSARIDMLDSRISKVNERLSERVQNNAELQNARNAGNEAEHIAFIETLNFLWATLRQHVNDTTGVILPEHIGTAMEEPADEARS